MGTRYRFLSKLEKLAVELYRRGDSVSHDDEWEKSRIFMYGFCDSGKTIDRKYLAESLVNWRPYDVFYQPFPRVRILKYLYDGSLLMRFIQISFKPLKPKTIETSNEGGLLSANKPPNDTGSSVNER